MALHTSFQCTTWYVLLTYWVWDKRERGLCSLGPFKGPTRGVRARKRALHGDQDGAVHPLHRSDGDAFRAWCDTNERREWGGYAVRSTPER